MFSTFCRSQEFSVFLSMNKLHFRNEVFAAPALGCLPCSPTESRMCFVSSIYIFSSFPSLCHDSSSKYRTASGQELDLLQNALTLEECQKPASVCLGCTETSKRGKNACRRSSFIPPPFHPSVCVRVPCQNIVVFNDFGECPCQLYSTFSYGQKVFLNLSYRPITFLS